MKKSLLLLLCCCSIIGAQAQYFRLQWMKSITPSITATSLAADAAGNVYTCGIFTDTADFDPGPGTFNLVSAGEEDFFIAKYDASGKLKWAKAMGGVETEHCFSIAISAAGDVLVCGTFGKTVDFDPGSGTAILNVAGNTDIFMLSIDAAGNFNWVKQIGGPWYEYGTLVSSDAAGNIYLTGSFDGATDFDPGPGTYLMSSASKPGDDYGFALKLDPSGNFVWARRFTGTANINGSCIRTDGSGNVYMTGTFWGIVDADPGSGVAELKSAGGVDAFVVKLDPSGSYLWARQIGGIGWENATSCTLDPGGNLYLGGDFSNTVDFDPGPGVLTLSSVPISMKNAFVLKLDSAGLFKWARSFGGGSGSSGIAVNAAGNVYTTGSYTVDGDFDPGPGTYYLRARSGGASDIFLSELDSAGNFVLAQSFGAAGYDAGRAVATNDSGHTYICGSFVDTVDFDPSGGTFYAGKDGASSSFVVKLDECKAYASSLSISTCKPYLFDGKLLSASGVYTASFKTAKGCDSTATLNLDFVKIKPVISSYGLSLGIGTIFGASYQWLECPSYTPIPGATGRVYIAPAKGSYAIVVTLGACSDTSDCYNAVPLDLAPLETEQAFIAQPNPTGGELRILSPALRNARMDLTDVLGRPWISGLSLSGDDVLDLSAFPAGVYFVKLTGEGQQHSIQRVIKY